MQPRLGSVSMNGIGWVVALLWASWASIGRYCECLVADPKRPVLRNPPIVPGPCHF